jgi:YfiH family protein
VEIKVAPDLQLVLPRSAWTGVQMFCTTRAGGVGSAPYDNFNLGLGAGDVPEVVHKNRQILRGLLPSDPVWLNQVHGIRVIDADDPAQSQEQGAAPRADASVTSQPGRVLAVLTADCLSVVIADESGSVVGAAHAGWKGLAGGVLEAMFEQLQHKRQRKGASDACIWRAWIGPGIGARAFQVGEDVRQSFGQDGDPSAGLFVVDPVELGKWRADLAGLAERRLVRLGIQQIERSGCCTVTDQTAEGAKKFFSYRRDRQTGRMATLVWLG